jgi:hypothetical protein
VAQAGLFVWLYDGHHRLQAFKELGLKSILVLKDTTQRGKEPAGTILICPTT